MTTTAAGCREKKRAPALPPGIRKHGAGFQVRASYRGEHVYQSFDLDSSHEEMLAWKATEVARMEAELPAVRSGTLTADATRYLKLSSIRAMPTYSERELHIAEWVAVLGHKRRRKITALDIEAQRDQWFLVSRGPGPDGQPLPPYSAASVNKRLRALSNLWTKLDTRRAPNPVLEVAECEEPDPEARGLPYDVIELILAAIPDTYTGFTKTNRRTAGKGIPRLGQNKARLRVIAYTGLAHKQLKQLTREDVDLEAGTVRIVARRKGKKLRRAQERALPQLIGLIPQAIEAFRDFDAKGCWGDFSNSSMWKMFTRACQQVDLAALGLRPYDLRHSFATLLYGGTRDLKATGTVLGHRSERTTRRYTMATVAPHVAAAIDAVRLKLAHGAGTRKDGT